MTTAQILYGVRKGELVHVDEVERGLACNCTCKACGRPLVARKGDILMHFFAHAADEVNCNPTPESLVHAYAKQQVAKLTKVVLPGFTVHAELESSDGCTHEAYRRIHPHYEREITGAEIEVEVRSAFQSVVVKPDVLLHSKHWRLAVEVYFRHKVPPEKLEKLQNYFYLSAVELDLSDLPVTASSREINAAIADLRRWVWLRNQETLQLRADLCRLLARSNSIFVPRHPEPTPRSRMNALPTRKIATADTLGERTRKLVKELRGLPQEAVLQRVRALATEPRIALHCHYLGIRPAQLPLHLTQSVDGQSAMGMHPILWQTGVFAKFCLQGSPFNARMVESWVRTAFDDEAFLSPEHLTQSTNHFSEVTEAIYHFLRDLSAQGLLAEHRERRPWKSTFAPVRNTRAEVMELLLTHPPALSQRKSRQ